MKTLLFILLLLGSQLSFAQDLPGPDRYEQICQELIKKAKKGDAKAMVDLGERYYYGYSHFGVELNEAEKAFEWFRKAAKKGNSRAMNNLGYYYQAGIGTKQNLKKAIEWYEKAIEENNPLSMAHLSYLYITGTGVEADEQQADYWKKRAMSIFDPEKQDIEEWGIVNPDIFNL